MSLTYDLSTNAKLAALAGGTHNVTIVAKADGYENSEPSTAVTVTKESAYKFKHFYDAGTIGSGTVKFRHYSQLEPSSGETWVLNESISGALAKTTVDFTSNNEQFTTIRMSPKGDLFYGKADTTETTVYFLSWQNTAYKTITFSTSLTGVLLTWLQANGTKQGGGGQ